MDKKDWISYNKKNIGWVIGLAAMTVAFYFLVTNFGLGMFNNFTNYSTNATALTGEPVAFFNFRGKTTR